MKRQRKSKKVSLTTAALLVLASMVVMPGITPTTMANDQDPVCVDGIPDPRTIVVSPDGTGEISVCLHPENPRATEPAPTPIAGATILQGHNAELEIDGPLVGGERDFVAVSTGFGGNSCTVLSGLPTLDCTLGAEVGPAIQEVKPGPEEPTGICIWDVTVTIVDPAGTTTVGPIEDAVLLPCEE